jgi:hypothetical protein
VADFDDIDALLSSSLKSAAEPANSAGVADAIRSRVAAGDAGTSVAGSTAPAWGGGTGGILTIVAPIALIVVAGVVGGSLGASGIAGSPAGPPDGTVPAYVMTPDHATAYLCPGGPVSGDLIANTRVLAVARNAEGGWLGVRDPADRTRVLWFEQADVVLDQGSPDPASLPVLGCPEPEVTIVEPEPDPEPTAQPTDEPDDDTPPPPSDTTAPALSKLSANPTLIINGQATQLSVSASDDVGVTAVQLTWTVPGNNGSAPMTFSNGQWRFSYSDNDLNDGFGNITFVARAADAAGNLSAPLQVVVNRQYLG